MQVHEDIREGRLCRVLHCELNVPVFSAPPGREQPLEGYDGGAFDPEKRGAAYIVVKVKNVEGVIKTNNRGAPWNLNPCGCAANQSRTTEQFMWKDPCSCRPCRGHTAPEIDFTPYKYSLKGHAQPLAADPSPANPPEASEANAPPGGWEASGLLLDYSTLEASGRQLEYSTLPPEAREQADRTAASTDDPPAVATPTGVRPNSTLHSESSHPHHEARSPHHYRHLL